MMRRVIPQSIALGLYIVALTFSVPPAHSQDTSPDEKCSTAASIGNDKDAAIAYCSGLIDSGQYTGYALGSLLRSRSLAYKDKKDYAHAIQDLDAAIKLKPDYYIYYDDRAWVFDETGIYSRAIEDETKAIDLVSNNSVLPKKDIEMDIFIMMQNRAIFYLSMGDTSKAIDDLNKVIASPYPVGAYFWLGCAYLKNHTYQKAIESFNNSIEEGKTHFVANELFGRGLAYAGLGDLASAKRDVSAARSQYPDVDKSFAQFGIRAPAGL
jgi:tetratricopeptide (TPR) repeat protein